MNIEKSFIGSDLESPGTPIGVKRCSSEFLESAPMLHSRQYIPTTGVMDNLSFRSIFGVVFGVIFYTILVIVICLALDQSFHGGTIKINHITTMIDGGEVCGTEIEGALAAGCKFDTLALTWLPSACYDEFVTQSSSDQLREESGLVKVDLNEFQFYADWNRTQPVTDLQFQQASLLNFGPAGVQTPFYTDTIYHKAHCQHVKELQDSALQKASEGTHDVWLWERAAKWDHSLHCHKIMYHATWNTPGIDTLAVYPGTSNCVLIRSSANL